MTTTKRSVAFKDVVAEPLNWKAPKSAAQESESADNQNERQEQGAEK